MEIAEFEKKIEELLETHDEDFPPPWLEMSLVLFVHADGCLGAMFRNKGVPCEALPWGEALAEIVKFVEAETAKLPAGQWDGEIPLWK